MSIRKSSTDYCQECSRTNGRPSLKRRVFRTFIYQIAMNKSGKRTGRFMVDVQCDTEEHNAKTSVVERDRSDRMEEVFNGDPFLS